MVFARFVWKVGKKGVSLRLLYTLYILYMFELKYPQTLAPMVPEGADDTQAEIFPLIDEEGQVVGRASRKYCHGGSMALHPVVHLHVMDCQGRLYLQKRSMKKDIAPGRWDTSVGGHVDYGESLLEAVKREAREELGVLMNNEELIMNNGQLGEVSGDELRFLFQYVWQSSREREVVTAFAVVYEGELHPDHDEVDEGRFWTLEELQAAMGKGVFTEQFEQQEMGRLLACL